jgi:hypothetical protein
MAIVRRTADHAEGVAAFKDKRPAKFTGRGTPAPRWSPPRVEGGRVGLHVGGRKLGEAPGASWREVVVTGQPQ